MPNGSARNLAEKHGIPLDSINADLDTDRYAMNHSEVKSYGRVPTEIQIATCVVKRHFDVDFIVCGRVVSNRIQYVLNVVGHDNERLLSAHLVICIARQMNRAWRIHRGRHRARTAFLRGFGVGIDDAVSKLRPPRAKSEALAISFRAYFDREFPNHREGTSLAKHAAPAAVSAGMFWGRATHVHRPCTSTADAQQLLPT